MIAESQDRCFESAGAGDTRAAIVSARCWFTKSIRSAWPSSGLIQTSGKSRWPVPNAQEQNPLSENSVACLKANLLLPGVILYSRQSLFHYPHAFHHLLKIAFY